MSSEIDFTKLDKRLIERMVRQGIVDQKTVEKALKGLEDLSDKAAPVEASLTENDDVAGESKEIIEE
jgi:hypothetical protein